MKWMLIPLLLGSAGCAKLACDGLSEGDCSANAACDPIYGYAIQADSSGTGCVDYDEPQAYAGCGTENGGCDDLMTSATDVAGDCSFYLPSSCLPSGWQTCETWENYEQCEP